MSIETLIAPVSLKDLAAKVGELLNENNLPIDCDVTACVKTSRWGNTSIEFASTFCDSVEKGGNPYGGDKLSYKVLSASTPAELLTKIHTHFHPAIKQNVKVEDVTV